MHAYVQFIPSNPETAPFNSILPVYRRERRRYAFRSWYQSCPLLLHPIHPLSKTPIVKLKSHLPSSRVIIVVKYKPSHHAPLEEIEHKPTNPETKRVRFEYRHDLLKESN